MRLCSEERRIAAIVMLAERERRMREAVRSTAAVDPTRDCTATRALRVKRIRRLALRT